MDENILCLFALEAWVDGESVPNEAFVLVGSAGERQSSEQLEHSIAVPPVAGGNHSPDVMIICQCGY